MSKRSDEQLRIMEELREQARVKQALADPADTSPKPHQAELRTAGATTKTFVEGWKKGLADEVADKTQEIERLASLLGELQLAGEWSTRVVDPALIDVVGFNRFSSTFDSTKDRGFADLQANIEAVGGNKQPGMVRPSPIAPGRFELVFGERRLRACQNAAVPFTAIVAAISDDDVWLFREVENFGRKDKGIVERALSIESSPERLASGERENLLVKLKVSHTQFQRLKNIASVPLSIWECVPNPHSISRREAESVFDAYKKDPKVVAANAKRISHDMTRQDAVLMLVTGTTTQLGPMPSKSGKASITCKGGQLTVRLTLDPSKTKSIEAQVREWLVSKGLMDAAS